MINIFRRNKFAGKFMILAHARSGSTNLSNILESNKKITIAGEPFHLSYKQWHPEDSGLFNETGTNPELKEALLSIYTKYTGIKTLFRHMTPEQNKFMLTLAGLKIICLTRQNLLQTVVSVFISGQTNIYYKRVDEEKNPLLDFKFEPISIAELSAEMKRLKDRIDFYKDTIRLKPANEVMELTYEDLYYSDLERKKTKIKEIFDFVGYDVPQNTAIDMFLDPSLAKMNSDETYSNIPNIREIEEKLGSDATGWLFKKSLVNDNFSSI